MDDLDQEKKWIEKSKNDFHFFGKLYDKYFDRIYAYIFSMLKSHEAAEDVVAETFEKAMLNIYKYEDKGFSFGAWLYRIARNNALDYIKSQKKLTQFDPNSVINISGKNTENSAEDKILQEKLWQNIQKIPENLREVLILRYIEGYSIKETAQIIDKTEDSVKSSAKRGLKKLRKLFKNNK